MKPLYREAMAKGKMKPPASKAFAFNRALHSCFPSKARTWCPEVCKRLTRVFCFGLWVKVSDLHNDKKHWTSQGNLWWKITGTELKPPRSAKKPLQSHLLPRTRTGGSFPNSHIKFSEKSAKDYLSTMTKQTYLHLNHPAWNIAVFGVLREAVFGEVTKSHLKKKKNLLIFPPSTFLPMHDDKTESSLKCTCQSCQPPAMLLCCLALLPGYSRMFSLRGGGAIWIWQNKAVWVTQHNQTVWSKTHRLPETAGSLGLRISAIAAPRSHHRAGPGAEGHPGDNSPWSPVNQLLLRALR